MRIIKAHLLITLIIVITVTPNYALSDSEMKKAKEFIVVGMKPQAITLLEKRIFDKPTDDEAHFLLATLYLSQGKLGDADQRFKSAMTINSEYGYKIGSEYKKEGSAALTKDQIRQADELFAQAVQFQPDLAMEIAKEYFDGGKTRLRQNDKRTADELLQKAIHYDVNYSKQVSDIYQQYARDLLSEAKSRPKEQRKQYIEKASQYLQKSEIDSAFPPPHLETILKRTFTGIGYTGGADGKGGIEVLCNNVDVKRRQTVYVEGKAQVYDNDGYENASSSFVNYVSGDKCLGMRAEKGQSFSVMLKEEKTSY